MHRTFSVSRLIGWSSLLALLTLQISLNPVLAQAQVQPVRFAQPGTPEIQQAATTMTLVVGTSQTFMMTNKEALKRVENPNNKVLDIRPVPNMPNEVQLIAVAPGRTRVTFTDVKNNVEILDVQVISDRVKELREAIIRSVPTASVNVSSTDSGATIILTGTVLNVEDLSAIRALAASVGGPVVNQVRIGGVQQVQLEVIVAIVNRSEARNMSFSWLENGPNWFVGSLLGGPFTLGSALATGASASTASISPTPSGANIPFGILNSKSSFLGFLQALRTENLAKIMAEPRVTTLSGRPAYIISGGETPLLTSSGQGAPSVSYKQFGTVVHFLPIVLGNGRIHLEVRPEISDIDSSLGISIPGVTPTIVPGFRTRSAQVTVQIEDGQTLAIGGLVQNVVNGSITRVPVLGDLPFLGTLFTSKTYTETEQELIILVTPRLVDPVDCTKFPRYLPGRETRSPDDFELFLEGILEAPRGKRDVIFHPGLYKPAFHGSPNAGQIPCGDIYGRSGISCANGSCGLPSNGTTVRPANHTMPSSAMPSTRMPSPSFPEISTMPTSNMRVTMEPEAFPPMRTPAGLGPVTPTSPLPPMPTLPAREFENRPSLPPVSSGGFGSR